MTMRSVLAWYYSGIRGSVRVVVMLLVLMMVLSEAVRVESARPMRAEGEDVRGSVAVAGSVEPESVSLAAGVEDDGRNAVVSHEWRMSAGTPGSLAGDAVDPIWDVEAESPPAQRQRDRSLWGMSKRLVPTGPNPLHN